jgi:hypothetical protein
MEQICGIGGIVLFTAVFATLSASYAMYTVFENEFTAVGFGILGINDF